MAEEARIKFTCPNCGRAVRWTDETQDGDLISCAGWGKEIGSFGDIKARGIEELRKHAIRAVKDILKR